MPSIWSKLFPYRERKTKRSIPELHSACYRGDFQRVQKCLQAGHNVNEPIDIDNSMNKTLNNVTPLFLAAQKSRSDVVRLLLQRGADPTIHAYCEKTKDHCSPVQVALLHMNPTIAMILKKAAHESVATLKKRMSGQGDGHHPRSSANSQSRGARASDGATTEHKSPHTGGAPSSRAGTATPPHLQDGQQAASSRQLSSQASSQGREPAQGEERKSKPDRPSPPHMASPFENRQTQEQAKQVVLQPAVSRMSSLSSNESLFGGKPAAPKQQQEQPPQQPQRPNPQQIQQQQLAAPKGQCEIEPLNEKPDPQPAPIYLPLPPTHSRSVSKEDGWVICHARSGSSPLTDLTASREGPLVAAITPTASNPLTAATSKDSPLAPKASIRSAREAPKVSALSPAASRDGPLAPKHSRALSARDVPAASALSPAASRDGLPARPQHGRSVTRDGPITSGLTPAASKEGLPSQPKHGRSATRDANPIPSGPSPAPPGLSGLSPAASRDGPLLPKHTHTRSDTRSAARYADAASPAASRDGPLLPKQNSHTRTASREVPTPSTLSPKASLKASIKGSIGAVTRHARTASSGDAGAASPKPKHGRTQSLQQKLENGLTSLSISAAQLTPQGVSENLRQRTQREEEVKRQREQEQQAKRAKVEEQKAKERQRQKERKRKKQDAKKV